MATKKENGKTVQIKTPKKPKAPVKWDALDAWNIVQNGKGAVDDFALLANHLSEYFPMVSADKLVNVAHYISALAVCANENLLNESVRHFHPGKSHLTDDERS